MESVLVWTLRIRYTCPGVPPGRSDPRQARFDWVCAPATGPGMWNFSTGRDGSVISTIIVPFGSSGLPGLSGLGRGPLSVVLLCVPANAITLPSGYRMKVGDRKSVV